MLLEAMTEHPGKLLTHRWLLEHVWGAGYQQDIEVLRVFVSQLRKKVEPDVTRPKVIVMDPGIGYRWTAKRSGRRVSRTTAERSWSTPGWSRSFVACTSLDRHEALVSGVSLDTVEGVASLIPWVSLSQHTLDHSSRRTHAGNDPRNSTPATSSSIAIASAVSG